MNPFGITPEMAQYYRANTVLPFENAQPNPGQLKFNQYFYNKEIYSYPRNTGWTYYTLFGRYPGWTNNICCQQNFNVTNELS